MFARIPLPKISFSYLKSLANSHGASNFQGARNISAVESNQSVNQMCQIFLRRDDGIARSFPPIYVHEKRSKINEKVIVMTSGLSSERPRGRKFTAAGPEKPESFVCYFKVSNFVSVIAPLPVITATPNAHLRAPCLSSTHP